MFQTIKGVNIGQGSGLAFGGGIYSTSCEIGFSSSPTTISINAVSESGFYKNVFPSVNSNIFDISINDKTFSGMHLVGVERTKNENSNLLLLSFSDSSIYWDKIFVGLLNRHGNLYSQTTRASGEFNIRCVSCTDGSMVDVDNFAYRYIDSIPVNSGCYFKKTSDGGGYIILGKESFPESNCEIPKVDYNFTELCNAMTQFGISHELSIFDINRNYRQEYAGSLREVLNNWASDFGFEFYLDGRTIKGIDLRKPIDISSVQRIAETGEFITNYNFSESLENSYSQSVVARYMKPSRAKEYSNTFHYKKNTKQLFLSDILPNGFSAGRNWATTTISCALGKFDPVLREAYIANYAYYNNDREALAALGFIPETCLMPSELSQVAREEILSSSQLAQNALGQPYASDINIDNFDVIVGYFREDVKSKVEQWDSSAANFIGKYYYFEDEVPENVFECPFSTDGFIYYTFSNQWETLPQSQIYGQDALPFSDIMTNPVADSTFYSSVLENLQIFSIEDNAWGIQESEFEEDKGGYNYSLFCKPEIIKFENVAVPGVLSLTAQANSVFQSSVNNIFATLSEEREEKSEQLGAELAYLIFPKLPSNVNIFPSIGPLTSSLVLNESAYDRQSERNSEEDAAVVCKTFCDLDIVSELCDCGSQYTPIPYFKNLYANYFNVYHPNGNISRIILPVNSDYFGFFAQNRYYKTTLPPVKSIYGEPKTVSSNSLATRVVDYDITPDLDASFSETNGISELIYTSEGQIISAEDYYSTLANMNNMTIPPQKMVKVTTARTDYDNIGLPISIASGLTSISMTVDGEGVSTSLSYSSRPPTIPKPEAIFSKIKYRLK